jgi:hypothetical protein
VSFRACDGLRAWVQVRILVRRYGHTKLISARILPLPSVPGGRRRGSVVSRLVSSHPLRPPRDIFRERQLHLSARGASTACRRLRSCARGRGRTGTAPRVCLAGGPASSAGFGLNGRFASAPRRHRPEPRLGASGLHFLPVELLPNLLVLDLLSRRIVKKKIFLFARTRR